MSRKYTLRSLLEEREKLDAELAVLRAEMRDAVRAEVMAKIEEFEFTAYELGLIKTQHIKPSSKEHRTFEQKVKNAPRPPLYRDPATGDTWSGRGRPPLWMEGHRDDYLIQQDLEKQWTPPQDELRPSWMNPAE
jgi:DNA-binding protein H-NS